MTSDVVLRVDGNKIPAHRYVLASRGQWCTQPLNTVSEIVLEDMSYGVARIIVSWLYTEVLDEAAMDVSALVGVMKAASKYKLTELTSRLGILKCVSMES
jgi:hypothetical protein